MALPDKKMQVESLRLESFNKKKSGSVKSKAGSTSKFVWPHPESFSANPRTLAEAGFYYNPAEGDDDNVKCYLCDKELGGWEEEDDPAELHTQKCPKCPWAIVKCALKGYKNARGSLHITNEDHLPMSKFMEKARLDTFGGKQKWWNFDSDKTAVATSKRMAKAGFVYTPETAGDDTVSCFYCDIVLNNWVKEDDPLEEHKTRAARTGNGCPFFDAKLETPPSQTHNRSKPSTSSRVSKAAPAKHQHQQPVSESEDELAPEPTAKRQSQRTLSKSTSSRSRLASSQSAAAALAEPAPGKSIKHKKTKSQPVITVDESLVKSTAKARAPSSSQAGRREAATKGRGKAKSRVEELEGDEEDDSPEPAPVHVPRGRSEKPSSGVNGKIAKGKSYQDLTMSLEDLEDTKSKRGPKKDPPRKSRSRSQSRTRKEPVIIEEDSDGGEDEVKPVSKPPATTSVKRKAGKASAASAASSTRSRAAHSRANSVTVTEAESEADGALSTKSKRGHGHARTRSRTTTATSATTTAATEDEEDRATELASVITHAAAVSATPAAIVEPEPKKPASKTVKSTRTASKQEQESTVAPPSAGHARPPSKQKTSRTVSQSKPKAVVEPVEVEESSHEVTMEVTDAYTTMALTELTTLTSVEDTDVVAMAVDDFTLPPVNEEPIPEPEPIKSVEHEEPAHQEIADVAMAVDVEAAPPLKQRPQSPGALEEEGGAPPDIQADEMPEDNDLLHSEHLDGRAAEPLDVAPLQSAPQDADPAPSSAPGSVPASAPEPEPEPAPAQASAFSQPAPIHIPAFQALDDDDNPFAPVPTPFTAKPAAPLDPLAAHNTSDALALLTAPQLGTLALTPAERAMTVEEWIRAEMARQYDVLRQDGERRIEAFKARAGEVRRMIEAL